MARGEPISPREFMSNSPDTASKQYVAPQRYQLQAGDNPSSMYCGKGLSSGYKIARG